MASPVEGASGVHCPRVWLLMGHKTGDNAQVLALADALGWPFEVKQLSYRRWELLTNLLLRRTLAGVVRRTSSPLAPPWPDLLITAGRRNEPVARWVQARCGGTAKIVHLGRPWAALEHFALVITTPQYRVPRRGNVLYNALPLHRVDRARLRVAAEEWSARFAHLPRPWIGLLVGGNSGSYTFDPRQARRLGRAASALAGKAGGSLLITTSARTPQNSTTALLRSLDVPRYTFRWSMRQGENPYHGYLALADEFVVTGDSISMLAEACATGRPVHIFYAPPTFARRELRSLRLLPLVSRVVTQLAPSRMKRDVGAVHRHLIASGCATWLGQPRQKPLRCHPTDDLPRAVSAVRALFAESDGSR